MQPSPFRGTPTPELDARWEEIADGNAFNVDSNKIHLLNKSLSQPWHHTEPIFGGGIAAQSWGSHQLHCLVREILRVKRPCYRPYDSLKQHRIFFVKWLLRKSIGKPINCLIFCVSPMKFAATTLVRALLPPYLRCFHNWKVWPKFNRLRSLHWSYSFRHDVPSWCDTILRHGTGSRRCVWCASHRLFCV